MDFNQFFLIFSTGMLFNNFEGPALPPLLTTSCFSQQTEDEWIRDVNCAKYVLRIFLRFLFWVSPHSFCRWGITNGLLHSGDNLANHAVTSILKYQAHVSFDLSRVLL